jgi:hypothetical protein
MLDRLGKRLNIALALGRVQLVQTQGWPRPRGRVLVDQEITDLAAGPMAVGKVLDELLAAGRYQGQSVSVLLADDLVRFWMVEPPRHASRLSDFESAAAMRFQTLFDEAPDPWKITASIDPRRPFLACAMPRSLHDQVVASAQRHRLTLLTIEPEFVALWNKWHSALRAGAWLGVWRGDSLKLGISQGHGLHAMRQVAVPPEALQDAEWLQQQIQREALRHNLAMPKALALCGRPPHPWVARGTVPVACELLGFQNDALSLFGVQA